MSPVKNIKKLSGDNRFLAIALIELNSVAVGITVGDAMAKKAPLVMLKAGTIHPGKYLIMIGGEVAAVDESYREGIRIGGEAIVDDVILPDAHEQVFAGINGAKLPNRQEALGVLETSTVAANVGAADAAVKGAEVTILEMRLADGLGGKSFTLFGGKVENVEAAINIGTARIKNKDIAVHTTIIPRIDNQMAEQVDLASRFFNSKRDD